MDWSGRLLDSRGNSETGEPLHGGSGSALAHRKASSLQRKSFFTFHINSMDGFVFQHYEIPLSNRGRDFFTYCSSLTVIRLFKNGCSNSN